MRRIVLLTVAGAASVGASIWGFVVGWHVPSGVHASVPFVLECLLPALSFPAFALYVRWPRPGVILVWLLLSGSWFAAFLLRLRVCVQQPCTTIDLLRVAWQTMIGETQLWLVLAVAVCLLLDYSELAVQQLRSRRGSPADSPPGN